MSPSLTPSQRLSALHQVAIVGRCIGVPEAIYVAEHGVTILANQITAARWAEFGPLLLDDDTEVTPVVTQVLPVGVVA